MFAARYHDPSLPTFSREEALTLIPRSNPFLGHLFIGLTGNQLDHRLVWIVDELVNVFLASDVASIMKNFGKSTKQEDPVVHFYETFLGAYNPALRKARGVWYTPAPVVNFIVRAVDDILKTEFDLPEGLADTSKKKIKVNYQGKIIEKEVHRVQVLDPATGTGTFLAETIKHIYKKYEGIQGMWSSYVENHLIPRMNGFELLMASYTMAHLKLDMLLTDTGYVPTKDQRLRVFLTNSLEEPNPDTGTLFGTLLSDEADQADQVKRDTPVMCVIGNPPYSVSSNNKSAWIERLIADYKKDLNEKSYNSLSDDYVKFIRFGQHFVEKNGDGVLAFISNNSFIDGVVFRQMRKHLLESFDKIYIIDLHGNSKKKEICLDGTTDQNVFDIMQGVSINIFVKTGLKKKNELAKLYNYDLFGKREFKYDFLSKNNINSIKWNNLNYTAPEYSFYLVNEKIKTEYNLLLSLDSLFIVKASGIQTEFDELSLHNTKQEAFEKLESIKNNSVENIIERYKFPSSKKLKINQAKLDVESNSVSFENVGYKLFNDKIAIYTGKTNGIMGRPRFETMKHLLKPNLALITMRTQIDTVLPSTYFISNKPIDKNFYGFQTYAFPIYLYADHNGQQTIDKSDHRTPNLNKEIVNQIAKKIGLTFTNEKETTVGTFAPIDLLDYIYGVLHSHTYREKYKEFLKVDFPRVPYPINQDTFWNLVKLGGEMRQIHLLESSTVHKPITKYPITGTNIVDKVKFVDGKVFINDTQYFEDVPEVAWSFYIGGYQPAQKWLKDRKDRELQPSDVFHYLKIIVALTETDRLMKEIDKIEIE